MTTIRLLRQAPRCAALTLAALLAASPASSDTQACGDFDGGGLVAASDALLTLKRAVGQNVTLQCPVCPGATTTTTGATTTTSVTTTTVGGTTTTIAVVTTTTTGPTTTIPVTTTTLGVGEIAASFGGSDICGDVDGSGLVAASDALLVLKRAVGQSVVLQCPGGCTGTLTLDAVSSGFYAQTGDHTPGNYAVGWYGPPNDDELRDYFVFELPPLGGTITSAHLHVSTAPPGFIVYGSEDPTETYTLFAVATPLASLTDGSAGVAAYDDLAEGVSYGSLVATEALGDTVDVDLGAEGLAYLAANAGVEVAFGGAITTLVKGATNEFLFNSTSASLTRQLVLEVE